MWTCTQFYVFWGKRKHYTKKCTVCPISGGEMGDPEIIPVVLQFRRDHYQVIVTALCHIRPKVQEFKKQ
jgi:hypothetical protein